MIRLVATTIGGSVAVTRRDTGGWWLVPWAEAIFDSLALPLRQRRNVVVMGRGARQSFVSPHGSIK